ncbi:flagellar type III secretion system pore protein FliP [Deltaproteobacteria bacterium OttesenSCG-928-K17]|nr:flagellar type III secretion system pore protein FliP [Deltaproteobacteria bacterium OttesenSCG-928-K17]
MTAFLKNMLPPFSGGRAPLLRLSALLAVLLLVGTAGVALAQSVPIPTVNISMDQADDPERIATVINILFLMTVLTLAPSILILMTSFVRIVVVFHFLKQGMGTQTTPPNQVIVGLALFLTFFIMMPVWRNIETNAFKPFMANQITQQVALDRTLAPVREFMFLQTREKDLALFLQLSGESRPLNKADVPTMSLIPAFVISELKTSFTIGFLLYIPFVVIDMVVASVLLSMGMMMLPPVMVSLPFKLMLFVLVDGWNLLIGSLVRSFGDVGAAIGALGVT